MTFCLQKSIVSSDEHEEKQMASVYVTRNGFELLNQRLADAVAKLKHAQSQKAEAADVGGDNWHDNFAFLLAKHA